MTREELEGFDIGRCEQCKWYDKGLCWRFPTHIRVRPSHWCGEFYWKDE